jgi:hypothetical protein
VIFCHQIAFLDTNILTKTTLLLSFVYELKADEKVVRAAGRDFSAR